MPPGLYFVATPIGAARDITLRALDILASADVLAAEDTRTLRRLMQIHGVPLGQRQVLAYHDHNGAAMRPKLLQKLADGASVAYASDAGTPLVADPGFPLARAAVEAGYPVTAAPGPSAALAALSVSGLPSDRFLFAGFPPTSRGQRRSWLTELLSVPATLVLYEAPRRIGKLLDDLMALDAGSRPIALCRELTKKFEEVHRSTVAELCAEADSLTLKGEAVVVLGRGEHLLDEIDVAAALLKARSEMSLKDAVQSVARAYDLPRRIVYQMALQQEGDP